MTDHILYETNHGVATITLNRPAVHNAFNEQTISELTDAFITAGGDKAIRVVVLKSNGKSFSAGADLDWMKRMAEFDEEENYQDSLGLAKLMQTIDKCPKPTIAIVNGAAYGGGVGLACVCDIAVGTDNAQFCLSEVKLGLIPAVISPYVIRAIGVRQARRTFLTAERIDAKASLQIGFLTHLVDENELQNTVDQLVTLLLKGAPSAQAACKALIRFVDDHPLSAEAIQETARQIAKTRACSEGKAGVQAFLNKQKPDWVER